MSQDDLERLISSVFYFEGCLGILTYMKYIQGKKRTCDFQGPDHGPQFSVVSVASTTSHQDLGLLGLTHDL